MAYKKDKLAEYEREPNTIHPLLDIGNYSGDSESRMGPTIMFLVGTFGAVALYIYFFLGKIPLKVGVPILILWSIRMAMLTFGRERERKADFRRKLYDLYDDPAEYDRLHYVHKDGLIETDNNHVSYMLVAVNGSYTSELKKAKMLTYFLKAVHGKYPVDHYELPITNDELVHRYKEMWRVKDKQRALDLAKILDHNRKLHSSESRAVLNVYLVSAYKQEFKALRSEVHKLLHSTVCRGFKEVFIADEEWVRDIISLDTGVPLDFDGMTRRKYAKHEYYGAYVMGYDIYEESERLRALSPNKAHNYEEVEGGFVEWTD